MLRSLYSGVSGLKNFQTKLDIIGNNIANVNTTGFKEGRITFKDMISQTLKNATNNGTNPIQVGTGSMVSSIDTIDTQGSLQNTGRTLDLAIQGDGYFLVQGGLYTRAGNLYQDNNGTLVTASGQPVLSVNTATAPPTLGGTITITPGSSDLTISPSGNITYTDASGNPQSAQLGLALFSNPGGLTKVGENMYKTSANSGNAQYVAPGSNGAGTIQSGFLEMSNVDLSNEMTDMIVAQRGFQANTKIITTSDQVLQELVNLKQ